MDLSAVHRMDGAGRGEPGAGHRGGGPGGGAEMDRGAGGPMDPAGGDGDGVLDEQRVGRDGSGIYSKRVYRVKREAHEGKDEAWFTV